MKCGLLTELNRCNEAIELLDKAIELNFLYITFFATKGMDYEKLGNIMERGSVMMGQ